MKFFIVFALVAAAAAQISNDYLPPHHAGFEDGGAGFGVGSYSAPASAATFSAPVASFETPEVAASAPAHSFSGDDGYRYKTQRRRVFKTARRHRRDVSSEYLPPVASAPAASYAAPAVAYSAPAASYSAPAASYSAPAASYSAPAASYSAPAASYSAPAASYSAPTETYDVAASSPAHSFSSDDGYRYKTQRRRVFKTARRHRRDVSSEYLPPVASAPAASYAAPAVAYSAPAASYSAPAASYSAPAASYSAPAASYSAPAASYSAPAASYSAPAETYDVAASSPAHSFSSDDGYRYKTQRRRVFKTARRHRRDVSSEYLPPVASAPAASYAAPAVAYSAPAASYSAPAASYSAPAASYSAPAASYSAPAASYSAPAETYDVAASSPAHSFSSDDGYRYKTQRRRVFKTARRHRRDVSSEYLPPVASAPAASYAAPAVAYSAPAASYSAPAASYSAPAASYSAPAASYSAPAASYSAPAETYDVAASAPAHSFSDADGYRYKTHRRRVLRRHRN